MLLWQSSSSGGIMLYTAKISLPPSLPSSWIGTSTTLKPWLTNSFKHSPVQNLTSLAAKTLVLFPDTFFNVRPSAAISSRSKNTSLSSTTSNRLNSPIRLSDSSDPQTSSLTSTRSSNSFASTFFTKPGSSGAMSVSKTRLAPSSAAVKPGSPAPAPSSMTDLSRKSNWEVASHRESSKAESQIHDPVNARPVKESYTSPSSWILSVWPAMSISLTAVVNSLWKLRQTVGF